MLAQMYTYRRINPNRLDSPPAPPVRWNMPHSVSPLVAFFFSFYYSYVGTLSLPFIVHTSIIQFKQYSKNRMTNRRNARTAPLLVISFLFASFLSNSSIVSAYRPTDSQFIAIPYRDSAILATATHKTRLSGAQNVSNIALDGWQMPSRIPVNYYLWL